MRYSGHPIFIVFLLSLSGFSFAKADFIPLQVTPDSFNVDVIVEKTAPPPLVPVTTASMDNGLGNTGFTFYERGYNPNAVGTGLPTAGTRFTSDLNPDHDFQFAISYKANNAFLVDSSITNATIAISNPVTCSSLSFLGAAGSGPGSVQFTLHFQNGGTQTGTLTFPDWYNGMNGACVAHGRADVVTFAFDSVNASTTPNLFSRDVLLAITNSPVTSIDLNWNGGAAHNAIFALSGAPTPDDPFAPIGISGYNADMIIEATAATAGHLIGATSAGIERGLANSGWTLYESGYYSPAPGTGLPPGGSVTSAAASDHQYAFVFGYTNNNAILLDSANPTADLALAATYSGSGLSFLCAASAGPVGLQAVLERVDGTAQTNLLTVPDWLSSGTAALVVTGRVSLSTRQVDRSAVTKFFSSDVALSGSSSGVTNVLFKFISGDGSSHGYVFGVSGAVSNAVLEAPVLTIARSGGSELTLTTTAPGELESTTALEGANTVWHDEGAVVTSTNLVIAQGGAVFFRMRR